MAQLPELLAEESESGLQTLHKKLCEVVRTSVPAMVTGEAELGGPLA